MDDIAVENKSEFIKVSIHLKFTSLSSLYTINHLVFIPVQYLRPGAWKYLVIAEQWELNVP